MSLEVVVDMQSVQAQLQAQGWQLFKQYQGPVFTGNTVPLDQALQSLPYNVPVILYVHWLPPGLLPTVPGVELLNTIFAGWWNGVAENVLARGVQSGIASQAWSAPDDLGNGWQAFYFYNQQRPLPPLVQPIADFLGSQTSVLAGFSAALGQLISDNMHVEYWIFVRPQDARKVGDFASTALQTGMWIVGGLAGLIVVSKVIGRL